MAIPNDYNFEQWQGKFAELGWLLSREICINTDGLSDRNVREHLHIFYGGTMDTSEYLDKITRTVFNYGSWEKPESIKEKRDNLLLEIMIIE